MSKSDRRHQLQQNELVRVLDQTVSTTRPFWPIIGGGIALALIVWIVMSFVSGRGEDEYTQLSDEFTEAMLAGTAGTNKLIDLTKKSSDSNFPVYARLRIADLKLFNSSNLRTILNSPDQARKQLDDAIRSYSEVVDAIDDDLLKQRALLNRAIARESLATISSQATGDKFSQLDRAKADYQTIITDWPDSYYAKRAKKYLDLLNKKDDQNITSINKFMAWLPDYKYVPKTRGGAGVAGTGSEELPKFPELKLPQTIEEAISTKPKVIPFKKKETTSNEKKDEKAEQEVSNPVEKKSAVDSKTSKTQKEAAKKTDVEKTAAEK